MMIINVQSSGDVFKVLSSELWNENMVAAWFQSLSPFQTEKESFNSSMILANVSCCGRRTEPQRGSSDLPLWHIKPRKSTGQYPQMLASKYF